MANNSKPNPYVRAVVDYGGLAAFIGAYFFRLRLVAGGALGWSLAIGGHTPRDLTAATWWLVAGSVISLLVGLIAERRIAPMPLIAGGFALLFGGLTLFFHDPRFIKLKPTVLYLVFASTLFVGQALKRNPLKWLLSDALTLPDEAWKILTFRYGACFVALAGVNEALVRTLSEAKWVAFHGLILTVLIVIFSLTQAPLLMKYMPDHDQHPATGE